MDEPSELEADISTRIGGFAGLAIEILETIADAFIAMYYLEASCAIQVRAQSGGGELISVPKEIMETGYAEAERAQRRRGGAGAIVWPGLLRRLDRTDPSYRN